MVERIQSNRRKGVIMINCAIYPRKSNAVDNSDSMETQISMCEDYLKRTYKKDEYTIKLYDGDYGITGHSTKNRKDFQRMMKDIANKEIQVVLVQRYDRLARNMRDFCNIYHDMEESGCILVSVSQQIDTSTPYGKNFMYQMANMAELEWSLTSERIKDANRYAVVQGKCRLSNKQLPFGYTTKRIDGIRKMVIDKETEPIVRDIFAEYSKSRNAYGTLRYINSKYNMQLCTDTIYRMVKNPFYHGEYKGNKHYCEAYITEEEQQKFQTEKFRTREIPTKKSEVLFAGLIPCPRCNRLLYGKGWQNGKNYLRYYKCRYTSNLSCDFRKTKSEKKIEKYLVENIDLYLEKLSVNIESTEQKAKDNSCKIKNIEKEMERLNVMFQKGRISEEKYDAEYLSLSIKKSQYEADTKPQEHLEELKNVFADNWKEIYYSLNDLNKKIFWRDIIKQIVVDDDFNIINIIFN